MSQNITKGIFSITSVARRLYPNFSKAKSPADARGVYPLLRAGPKKSERHVLVHKLSQLSQYGQQGNGRTSCIVGSSS